MTDIWAIVGPAGDTVLRYDDPEINDDPAELEGRAVWPLDREPVAASGERVDFSTGAIVFDVALVLDQLVGEIKAVAGRRITDAVPLWKQMNDAADPDAPGRDDRRAQIDAIRAWSNDLESQLAAATDADTVVAIRLELTSH